MKHLPRATVVSLVASLFCFSCGVVAPTADIKAVRIMTWNTQNLFDDQKNGGEYPEFTPGTESGWNRDTYRTRLERAAGVIANGASLPDIVILQEIESMKVLEDLSADFLPSGSYPVRMLQDDEGSIHVALLSRIPVLLARSHRIWLNGNSARSVWELHLSPETGPSLVLLANHWKSKSGGEAETEALRILAAKAIRDRTAVLRSEDPLVDIVVCGDLNETIHDSTDSLSMRSRGRRLGKITNYQRSNPAYEAVFALGRASDDSVTTQEAHRAVLWVHNGFRPGLPSDQWISPWTADSKDQAGKSGSYFWQGEWEAIDHFLLATTLFDNSGWVHAGFNVVLDASMLDFSGIPVRYDTRSRKGVSDHLPLVLELSAARN